MRFGRRAGMFWLITVGVAAGCSSEAATGPLADLVGTWTVVQLEYANQANSSEVVNVLTLGRTATFSVTNEGDWRLIVIRPSPVRFEIDDGTLTLQGDSLFLSETGGSGPVGFAMDLTGETLTLVTEEAEYDFDSDGTEEPAYFTMAMRR